MQDHLHYGAFLVTFDEEGATITRGVDKFRINSERASNPVYFVRNYGEMFHVIRDHTGTGTPEILEPFRVEE
jgi:hypothetical protein